MTTESEARVFYVDSSAMVKLVLEEQSSGAMRVWRQDHQIVVSDITWIEVRRAIRRWSPSRESAAIQFLSAADLIDLRGSSFDLAARLDPPELRSLDALHLAAARELGPDLAGVVTYDERMSQAARALGMNVVAPA